jgi:hypothetical protein
MASSSGPPNLGGVTLCITGADLCAACAVLLFLLLFLMMTMSSTILLPPMSLSLAPDWGSHSLLGGACKSKVK